MCTYNIQMPDAASTKIQRYADEYGQTAEEFLTSFVLMSIEDMDDTIRFRQLMASRPEGMQMIGEEETTALLNMLEEKSRA